MNFVKPDFEILDKLDGKEILKKIEKCGRTAYKSESNITDGSAEKMISKLIDWGHESVIEHFSFTVKFTTDRSISHEIVRHRLASYTQESTRYCNYQNKGLQFIMPLAFENDKAAAGLFIQHCSTSELDYNTLISLGYKPQDARAVLPNALKTEIVMTANLREWRHFLKLRCAKDAHPEIRRLVIPLLEELKKQIPIVFDDILVEV